MLTIHTSKATVLAVRLPKGAENVKVLDNSLVEYDIETEFAIGSNGFGLPIGSWQPLGFANQLSESDMERIVEQVHEPSLPNDIIWTDYVDVGIEKRDIHRSRIVSIGFDNVTQSYETWKSKHGISEEHFLLIKID